MVIIDSFEGEKKQQKKRKKEQSWQWKKGRKQFMNKKVAMWCVGDVNENGKRAGNVRLNTHTEKKRTTKNE